MSEAKEIMIVYNRHVTQACVAILQLFQLSLTGFSPCMIDSYDVSTLLIGCC